MKLPVWHWLLLAALGLQFPVSAVAQRKIPTEKNVVREGFRFAPGEKVRIAVFPPDAEVSELNAAGMALPDANATDKARNALVKSLQSAPAFSHIDWVIVEPAEARKLPSLASHRALFQLVVDAAIRHHLFATDPLPTKSTKFQWTLGAEMGAYADKTDASYALFVFTRDTRNSVGKKAMQALSTALGNAVDRGKHLGYAGLVELKTGELVWLNVNLKMSADFESEAGASVRVGQLLNGFPVGGEGQSK